MDASVSKRPASTDFKQQRLKAWQPILTPKWVIGTFLVVGIVFIPLGAGLLVTSLGVKEYVQRYDDVCTTFATTCTVSLNVAETMTAPVYLYYQLDNFYQNHRRYVKSRSDAQLRGESLGAGSLSDCDPLITKADGSVYNPCGLVARSVFNDTYSLDLGGTAVTVLESDISWQSDRDYKFKAAAGQDIDVTNEHFIVWMRTAALPTFRKLWGRITSDVQAGTYTVTVNNNYDVSKFSGKKSIVLSTTSWLGGRNNFLGIAYIVVGSICILLALAFLVKHKVSGRELGSAAHLKWDN